MPMWPLLTDAAWVVSIAIFAWLIWDFIRVNMRYSESVLLSSREGVDELFAETGQQEPR
jgi:hypothetical protein